MLTLLAPPVTFCRGRLSERMTDWTADIEIDCEGLLCPLPVLRARKRLQSMLPGQILCVRASDAMAAIDLPHFCAETGHDYLGAQAAASLSVQTGTVTRHFLRVGR